MAAHPFFTIGHATRSIEGFIELLQGSSITYLADVRTVPRSRTNPQYNRDTLPQALAVVSIGYEHIASLGGLRSRKREVPRETNAFWQNGSFHNYADHAMSAAFHEGLGSFARSRADATLRHHVRGNIVVAMSPPHHHRLSARRRRDRVSHSGTRADQTGRDESGGARHG